MSRVAPRAWLVVVALALAVLAVPGKPPAEAAAANARWDPAVSARACALVGRVHRPELGCSRVRCVRAGDVVAGGRDVETCRLPGGGAHGTRVDPRTCAALHRRWLPVVNSCASNARRHVARLDRAAQCVAPFTTYVTLTETEGDYDLCLTPARTNTLSLLAWRSRQTLAAVASVRSATLCALRPGSRFVLGVCEAATTTVDRSEAEGTLVIGDSLTWRGTDELVRPRPDWTVDGYPGRRVSALPTRLEHYLLGHPDPEVLVIALGTNTGPEWTKQHYLDVIDAVPLTRAVVLVTPFRSTVTPGAALVAQHAGWMLEITAERAHTCLADWAAIARSRPDLLVDGVHATRAGDRVWAGLIQATRDTCAAG